MSGGGIIVRLIDIVLLLLLGFISISKIEKKSEISLPESYVSLQDKKQAEQFIVIGINNTLKGVSYFDENQQMPLKDFNSVKEFILKQIEFYEKHQAKAKVRIRPNWNLETKYVMRIAKFCQQKGIKVGLEVKRSEKAID